MPFCGFNQNMLDGLRQFGEGLWEQVEFWASLRKILCGIKRSVVPRCSPNRFIGPHSVPKNRR